MSVIEQERSETATPKEAPADRGQWIERYRSVRGLSLELCEPLEAEDFRIQSMADVSPPWWNLGHTSWFFAKNLLEPRGAGAAVDQQLEYVLNSYYETHGRRLARAERGNVGRPTTQQILAFREQVDERVEALVASCDEQDLQTVTFLVEAGIQHEQQHQELLLSEIKHILGSNPLELRTPYNKAPTDAPLVLGSLGQTKGRFVDVPCGVVACGARERRSEAGYEGGWSWDNEAPVHRRYLEPFALFSRLITNREYLEFMEDGGYERPLLWLSNGWNAVQTLGLSSPLYWYSVPGGWKNWTLQGDRPLALDEPVAHVSFYEAQAFAQWKADVDQGFKGARLPTEFELEQAANTFDFVRPDSNLLDRRLFRPTARDSEGTGPDETVFQLAGNLWEWTSSHYEPYPGYQPFAGDLMEYNGKFMDNQRVLRGGSFATPADHLRPSYRNFWPAETQFQFTGIRLARSV